MSNPETSTLRLHASRPCTSVSVRPAPPGDIVSPDCGECVPCLARYALRLKADVETAQAKALDAAILAHDRDLRLRNVKTTAFLDAEAADTRFFNHAACEHTSLRFDCSGGVCPLCERDQQRDTIRQLLQLVREGRGLHVETCRATELCTFVERADRALRRYGDTEPVEPVLRAEAPRTAPPDNVCDLCATGMLVCRNYCSPFMVDPDRPGSPPRPHHHAFKRGVVICTKETR